MEKEEGGRVRGFRVRKLALGALLPGRLGDAGAPWGVGNETLPSFVHESSLSCWVSTLSCSPPSVWCPCSMNPRSRCLRVQYFTLLMIQRLQTCCSYIPFNELLPTSLLCFCFMIPGYPRLFRPVVSTQHLSVTCLLTTLSVDSFGKSLFPFSECEFDDDSQTLSDIVFPNKEPVLDRELIKGNLTGSGLCFKT